MDEHCICKMEFPEGVKGFHGNGFEEREELSFPIGLEKKFIKTSLNAIHFIIYCNDKNLSFGYDMLTSADAGFSIMNCNYENRGFMAHDFEELLEVEKMINHTEEKFNLYVEAIV